MRILDLVSGVETWKATLSKSDATWSIETGGALQFGLAVVCKVECVGNVYPEKRSVSSD